MFQKGRTAKGNKKETEKNEQTSRKVVFFEEKMSIIELELKL